MENLNLFIRSIFVDNMIFAYFLGMCSFLAVSKNVKTALGLGVAVTFMLVITLPINYLLQTYVLQAGALQWLGPEYADVDLSFLSLIMFIAGHRMAAGHCGHCGHTRTPRHLFQHSPSASRNRHHLHPHRPHGHSLHEFPRHQNLNTYNDDI